MFLGSDNNLTMADIWHFFDVWIYNSAVFPDVDECHTSPCENGATCVEEIDGYRCLCTEQYLNINCTGMYRVILDS